MSIELTTTRVPVAPELRDAIAEAEHREALELDALAPDLREVAITLGLRIDRSLEDAVLYGPPAAPAHHARGRARRS